MDSESFQLDKTFKIIAWAPGGWKCGLKPRATFPEITGAALECHLSWQRYPL